MIGRQLTQRCISKAPGVENFNQRSDHFSSKPKKGFLSGYEFLFRYLRPMRIAHWIRGIAALTTVSFTIDRFLSIPQYIPYTEKTRHSIVGPNNSIELISKSYLVKVVRLNLQLFFLSVIVMVFPDYFFSYDPDRLSGFVSMQPFSYQFIPKKTSQI